MSYTSTPKVIRVFDEDDGWAIDGFDPATESYTDAVWKYDSEEEAVQHVAEFISYGPHYLFEFQWPTDRAFQVGQWVYLTEGYVTGKVVATNDEGNYVVDTDGEFGVYSEEFMEAV